jgi:multimeric flavodoxin WrbA
MTRILVVYHSQTGNTEKMAQAVAEGVRFIDNAEAVIKKAQDASVADLLAADGLAIGTPENFGYMAGMIKDFFDRTFYPAHDKVFRKPYVVFVSAGNDGGGALKSVERIALGYKFKKVYEPVIAVGAVTVEIIERCRNLGGVLAGGCQMGIF